MCQSARVNAAEVFGQAMHLQFNHGQELSLRKRLNNE
jgi:hypothetical protein